MLHDRSSEAGSHANLTLKAWNTRVFMAYLNECLASYISENRVSAGSDLELLLAASGTRSMVLWFWEQERANRRFLTLAQAESIAGHGWEYLKTVSALARDATANGRLRWKIIPKHHEHQLNMVQICFICFEISSVSSTCYSYCNVNAALPQAYGHIQEDILEKLENPRAYHCFTDEDSVHQWKKLAIAMPATCIEDRMMTRYLIRLGAQAR